MGLEHRERQRWVEEIGKINQQIEARKWSSTLIAKNKDPNHIFLDMGPMNPEDLKKNRKSS
nr:hypothetical protein [Gloeobacter kilaueensis]